MPLIYSGQEAGLNRRLEFFEKDQIDWSDLSMSTFYKELIRLKKENEALWNGNHGGKIELIATDRPEEVLMFTRRSGSNQVVAVFNLSGNEVEVSAETTISGQYPDFFTGNIVSLPLKGFSLNPWEYRIISIQE
jgi:glycosidase